jgi:hypothetical protein
MNAASYTDFSTHSRWLGAIFMRVKEDTYNMEQILRFLPHHYLKAISISIINFPICQSFISENKNDVGYFQI